MREALARTTADRFAWFWMVFEPIALVGLMVSVRTLVFGTNRFIMGADFIPWLITGLLGFFLFRENMMRPLNAIEANRGLFSYRQVRPVDTVFVRCLLEGVLKTFIIFIFIGCGAVLGFNIIPDNPLAALAAWVGLWIMGAGFGLIFSVASTLIPELGRIIRITTLPLMLVSGVIIPLNFLHHEVREIILYIPIVHALEMLRQGFFSTYHALPGVNPVYMWVWSLSVVALGLLLHVKYADELKAA